MSDLQCGCNNSCDCGNSNNNSCGSIIWILILLCCCGNKGGFGGSCGSNNNGCDCIWIILLLYAVATEILSANLRTLIIDILISDPAAVHSAAEYMLNYLI